MTIDQMQSVAAELAAIVGEAQVCAATSDDAIVGVQPQLVVEPHNGDAIAAVLRYANKRGLAIAPRGGGTKRAWGNPPARLDLVLSTRRLDQVLEHAWGDMTATVQVGCTVAVFQRALAAHGQRLALDPLWPDQATIGGILATNDSGSLRQRFGSLRDLVLGVTVALPDGTLARSGGKVVKNVAGYDLPKLMNGALGTLGVIVDATFRLYPLPGNSASLWVELPSIDAANRFMLAILDSTLVTTGLQLLVHPDSAPHVAIRLEGIDAAIASQIERIERMARDHGAPTIVEAEAGVWRARETLWQGDDPALVCTVRVLPTEITALTAAIERVATPLRIGWRLVMQALGVGTLRLDGSNAEVLLAALTLLRSEIAQKDGSCVVLHAPADLATRIDVWGAVGDALPLMRRVKEQFDPNNILNPGRYVGGI